MARGWSYAGAAIFWAIVSATPAASLSLLLEGPTTGPLAQGLGVEQATPGDSLTFTISLDASVALMGYDLLIAWDATELALLAATDLSGLGFDVDPSSTAGMPRRVAAIELNAVTTAALVQLQFAVLAVVSDGAADLSIAANGAGLSPGGLVLGSLTGAGIAIPEPSHAVLLILGLLGLYRFTGSFHDLAP